MSTTPPPNVRQPYYPPLDPSIPPQVATHLRLLYTGLNQHDQVLTSQAQNTSTTPTSSSSNAQSTGGGATGTVTLAALTVSGSQGSLTIDNGLITSYTNPT